MNGIRRSIALWVKCAAANMNAIINARQIYAFARDILNLPRSFIACVYLKMSMPQKSAMKAAVIGKVSRAKIYVIPAYIMITRSIRARGL